MKLTNVTENKIRSVINVNYLREEKKFLLKQTNDKITIS